MPKSTDTHQYHGIAKCPVCGKMRQRDKEAVATWLCSRACRDLYFSRKGWNVDVQCTTDNDTLQEE